MNFLLVEVEGEDVTFRGGMLDGRAFERGEMIFISGNELSFTPGNIPTGTWWLQRTRSRGKIAIVCGFFDKRSGRVVERYSKIVHRDGWYMCGPRFPRVITEAEAERKLAA